MQASGDAPSVFDVAVDVDVEVDVVIVLAAVTCAT